MGVKGPRRWPWQEYEGSLSPGWGIVFVMSGVLACGLLLYWVQDMHHYGYGIFAR